MTTCREVMTTNPACCVPTDTAQQVAQMMQMQNVGSIPVVENQNSRKLVGIVTDRDLAMRLVADNRGAQYTTVDAVMTPDPVTCHERDDLDRALQAMSDHQVRRVPVLNDRNEIVGIIAQADIATRTEQPKKTAEVVEEISKPSLVNS